MQKTPIFLVNMKNLHSKFFLKTALRVVERKEEMVLVCSNFGMKDIQIKFVSRPKQFQMFSRSIRSGSTTFSRNFFFVGNVSAGDHGVMLIHHNYAALCMT